MNAKEAADKIRPDFHLVSMPPEDHHHVKFVEDVAAELGVEPTPFNLHQVGQALDHADIHGDSIEFPKMLYSRSHHAEGTIEASFYDARHDWVWAHVANQEEADKLGSGWVEDPADLPPRGEIPLHAAVPEKSIDQLYDEQFAADNAKFGGAPLLKEPKAGQQALLNEPKAGQQDNAGNIS